MVFNATFNAISVISWRSILRIIIVICGFDFIDMNIHVYCKMIVDFLPEEKFEDTKGVIRIRKSKIPKG